MSDYILIQSTHAPYHSSHAIDAYEAALGASNLGLHVKIIFSGLGLFQLLEKQEPAYIKHKNMAKKISALPLFDVEDLFVTEHDLTNYSLCIDDLKPSVQVLSEQELSTLFKDASSVMVY